MSLYRYCKPKVRDYHKQVELGFKETWLVRNSVRFHNENETLDHFIYKAILAWIINTKLGNTVLTEVDMNVSKPDKGKFNDLCVADVMDFKNNTKTVGIYEVETNLTNESLARKLEQYDHKLIDEVHVIDVEEVKKECGTDYEKIKIYLEGKYVLGVI